MKGLSIISKASPLHLVLNGYPNEVGHLMNTYNNHEYDSMIGPGITRTTSFFYKLVLLGTRSEFKNHCSIHYENKTDHLAWIVYLLFVYHHCKLDF